MERVASTHRLLDTLLASPKLTNGLCSVIVALAIFRTTVSTKRDPLSLVLLTHGERHEPCTDLCQLRRRRRSQRHVSRAGEGCC